MSAASRTNKFPSICRRCKKVVPVGQGWVKVEFGKSYVEHNLCPDDSGMLRKFTREGMELADLDDMTASDLNPDEGDKG